MARGQRIAVAMSGGVDSSVAALLLKEQGYEVVGIFMKNWEEENSSDSRCQAAEDYEDVAYTCSKLKIPYLGFNFVAEYRQEVFSHFISEYQKGYTPNPDVLCNREIKFKVFYDKALDLGCDAIATGHYCRTKGGKLLKGVDSAKDQSYFLYAIGGQKLERVLFPIGHLEKASVRDIAAKAGLPTHAKKDSTGICFIGERKFKEFLQKYLPVRKGAFMTLDGNVVGEHCGVAFYTLGQRRHLGLGGPGQRWHVVKKDPSTNVVYVARDRDHPLLYSSFLVAGDESWIAGVPPKLPLRCSAKVRYRQADQECRIERSQSSGQLGVYFAKPQWAITPSQSVVFYSGDSCLGGAVIRSSPQS